MTIERFDLDSDIGELDMESCAALLALAALWQARRSLRWRWMLRAQLSKGS